MEFDFSPPPLRREAARSKRDLKPAPSLLSPSQRRLFSFFALVALFVVAGVVVFSIWAISTSDHSTVAEPKLRKTDSDTLPKRAPQEPKRIIAKTKTLPKPPPIPSPVEKIVPPRPQAPPVSKALECTSGWHSEDGECRKNSLFPNPVDRSMMRLNGTTPYQYACGTYVDDPGNMERDSTFLYTYHNNRKLMREIALSKPSPIVASFMDSCLRELDQPEPSTIVNEMLARIDEMEGIGELPEVMGFLHRYDTTLPIELSFELDLLDGKRLVPLIKQSGIFANSVEELRDRSHALQISQRFLGTLVDSPVDASQMTKDVINIELTLSSAQHLSFASNILDYVGAYQRDDLHYEWYDGIAKTMERDGFNLTRFLVSTVDSQLTELQFLNDLRTRPMWIYSQSYMERFAQLHRSHSLSAWQNYLRHAVLFNLVNDDSPHIDPESHYAYHRNYESRYSLPWQRPRRFLTVSPNHPENGGKPSKQDALSVRQHKNDEEQCAFISEAYLPVILDDFFLHARLSDGLRQRAREMVQSIRDEFISNLEDERSGQFAYFDAPTKLVALAKVKSMHFIVGAPDHWEERDERQEALSRLVKVDASFTDNMLAIRKFHMQEQALLYHQHVRSSRPVDRDRLFDGMVSTVNAFYQHQLNTIMISAGILQPPVFSEHYDVEAWYARLGVFLGHEMSHALDTIGTQFDGDGSVNPWISNQESLAYQEHNRRLISLYNTFTDNGNRHDGIKTLNENIADQIGFPIALSAARKAKANLNLQEFFLSYAQLYCEAISNEHEKQLISTQSHSVGSMRVNKVLQEQSEFRAWWPTRPR